MEEEQQQEEVLGSSLTMEKVAAAKQFIENHYKTQMKSIQDRKERYLFFFFLLFVENILMLFSASLLDFAASQLACASRRDLLIVFMSLVCMSSWLELYK